MLLCTLSACLMALVVAKIRCILVINGSHLQTYWCSFCHPIQLQSCIGAAVIAMGPEKILSDVPISLNASECTCSNIWLVPILKKYVVGASLEYYIEHVLPLAKSFRQAGCKGISLWEKGYLLKSDFEEK